MGESLPFHYVPLLPFLPHPQIDHLHQQGKEHCKINVTLRNMNTANWKAFNQQHKSNQDQE